MLFSTSGCLVRHTTCSLNDIRRRYILKNFPFWSKDTENTISNCCRMIFRHLILAKSFWQILDIITEKSPLKSISSRMTSTSSSFIGVENFFFTLNCFLQFDLHPVYLFSFFSFAFYGSRFFHFYQSIRFFILIPYIGCKTLQNLV